MSMWNEDDEFRDNVADEVDQNGMPLHAPAPVPVSDSQKKAIQDARAVRAHVQAQQVQQAEPEIEIPEIDMDAEEDYTSVLTDARHRLELGRLWEQIINHDIFEGTDADPTAAKLVQSEIRKFAKERIEIMLGMRRDTTKVERFEIDFPFNAVEVNVLKKLAHAASKGASDNSDRYVPAVTRTTEEVDNVGPSQPPRREGLNKIGARPQQTKPAPVAQKAAPAKAPQAKAAPAAENKPLPKTAQSSLMRQKAQEAGLSEEETALLEPDYKPISKPFDQMTEQEKLDRMKETTARLAKRRSVKSPLAIPMATPQQEEMLAQQHVFEAASNPRGTIGGLIALINAGAATKK